VKLALPFGLAGTFSAFDIAYSNVVTEDPANPLLGLQAGKERSTGFDGDLTWQPLAGLSILANYAYVNARVVQDNFFAIGNRVDFVPQNSGRLWINYKFQGGWLKDIVLGAGLYSATKQTLDLTDQFWTPGYTIFDGKIGYEAKNWSVALIGRNLTDRHYFIPYSFFTYGHVAPGTPLSILVSLTVKN
jgi:iron complex outermembrane receptor protein